MTLDQRRTPIRPCWFGIWIEPEMVNPDSDLYRAHPDWILATGRRVPPLQRGQLALDLTRPEVTGYLMERIGVLLEYEISYVKWDHNRDLVDAGATARAGHRRCTSKRSPTTRCSTNCAAATRGWNGKAALAAAVPPEYCGALSSCSPRRRDRPLFET